MSGFESRLISKNYILKDKHDVLFDGNVLCAISINIADIAPIIDALNSAYTLGIKSGEKQIALANDYKPYQILSESSYNILNEEEIDLYIRLPGGSIYGLNHLNTDVALKFVELMNYAHTEGVKSVINFSENVGPEC